MHTFSRDTVQVFKNVAYWATRRDRDGDNYFSDTLVMWLKFKRVYRSGHFHNKKVSQALHISKPTYLKYIKRFIDLGWAEKEGDGFRLISIKKQHDLIASIHSRFNFWGKQTLLNDTKSLLRTQLRWIALEQKHNQIRFREGCRKAAINYSNDRRIKGTLLRICMSHSPASASMSVKTIGKSFQRSKSTGWNEKLKMKELGLITLRTQEATVLKENVPYGVWIRTQEDYPSGCYYFNMDGYVNGLIMQRNPDRITIRNPFLGSNNTVQQILPS